MRCHSASLVRLAEDGERLRLRLLVFILLFSPRQMSKFIIPASIFNHWFTKLVKSLHMSYSEPDGSPKTVFKRGDRVRAEPKFDDGLVEQMYMELPKSWAKTIYTRAFEVCEARADRMLKDFDAKQQVINRRHYYNALYRFSLFAPNEAAVIDKRRIKGPLELLKESREGVS